MMSDMYIEAIYFQNADSESEFYGLYGEVYDAVVINKNNEREIHLHVGYTNGKFDYVPASKYSEDANSHYWICSYAQTQS